jgi:hypothetical protein
MLNIREYEATLVLENDIFEDLIEVSEKEGVPISELVSAAVVIQIENYREIKKRKGERAFRI